MAGIGDYNLPKRMLGKTGEKISSIGFGGITLRNKGQAFANEIIARAYGSGCRYYDVAPTYGDAQQLLGPALKNYRKESFLACKTKERVAAGAEKELHKSLEDLKTDYLDLYQLHAITTEEEVEKAFAPGGAMEIITRAREKGKIKYIGFSAHSTEAALLAMSKFDFDTILFPINYACWYHGNFGPAVYKEANDKDMGILSIKAFAVRRLQQGEKRPYPNMWYIGTEDEKLSEQAFRFTMSKNVSATIPSGDASYFWKAMKYMKDFSPISEQEAKVLQQKSASVKPIFPKG